MKTIRNRLAVLQLCLILIFSLTAVYLAHLVQKPELRQTAAGQGTYTCLAGTAEGTIYDRNGVPLINASHTCEAVVCPTLEAVTALLPHLIDPTAFFQKAESGRPFVCTIDTSEIDCPDVTVLKIPRRYSAEQPAQHLIGYTAQGAGVSGLEYAYDSLLRREQSQWTITFSVDGTGSALAGENTQIRYGANPSWGVVTTLDASIQRICDTAGKQLKKGCVVVLDAENGDILGLSSFPTYHPEQLEAALQNPDSPLINRACYAYPVGSIFKLVTAACAKEQGNAYSFRWNCTGSVAIGTQIFRCHDANGHGEQSMLEAMRNSCNPYFIALSQELPAASMLQMAKALGFGTETPLTETILGAAGTLPTKEQLRLPAEQANFCFGQGILTATPLQIARMTCAIAGDGTLPAIRLIRGSTEDGKTVQQETPSRRENGISAETAAFLRSLMCYTAADEAFQGKPGNVSMGAKTSTAQTGRYDADGQEYCHGWVTSFFPAQQPRYVVTVLAEDGGYGNQTAAPVLRQIAGAILDLET